MNEYLSQIPHNIYVNKAWNVGVNMASDEFHIAFRIEDSGIWCCSATKITFSRCRYL